MVNALTILMSDQKSLYFSLFCAMILHKELHNRGKYMGVKSQKKSVEIMERRRIAVKLRLDGYTYREIADAMFGLSAKDQVTLPDSYDERYACRDVNSAIQEMKDELIETADMLRVMELANCDRLQNAIMDRALKGDLKAIDRVLSIMNQRAKYVPDLVEPKKLEVTSYKSEIMGLIQAGKITIEDVSNVAPAIAKQIMAELAQRRGAPRISEGRDYIEGEYADLGTADEDVS